MNDRKIISGKAEDDVWQQVNADLGNNADVLDYKATLEQAGNSVLFDIDIDPGGGFESGIASTRFAALLTPTTAFRFSVHEDHFIDDLGKFFGLQDVKLGYPALDHHLVIKTNNEQKLKALFAPEKVRQIFETLRNFDFGIRKHHTGEHLHTQIYLELNINDTMNEPDVLRPIYSAFYEVMMILRNIELLSDY